MSAAYDVARIAFSAVPGLRPNVVFNADSDNYDKKVAMSEANQSFTEIDTDNDGYISVAELKAYLDQSREVSEGANARYHGLLDKNKDGQISREEFEKSFLARG
ncbi:EF-hand domain-containing protein [Nocardia goodfellowii]